MKREGTLLDRPDIDAGYDSSINPESVGIPSRKRSHWPWAIALMFTVACASTVYLVGRFTSIPGEVVRGLGPQSTYTTAIHNTVGTLRGVKKLVVLNVPISAEITKSKETRVIYGKVNMGTTVVTLRANDNKVQFYIPLEDMKQEDFQYDKQRRVILVNIPKPMLDEDMVEVQTDPNKIEIRTDVGWASLNSREGNFLREEPKAELRPRVLATAKDYPLLQAHAADRGLIVFREDIVARLADALGQDLVAEVRYRE